MNFFNTKMSSLIYEYVTQLLKKVIYFTHSFVRYNHIISNFPFNITLLTCFIHKNFNFGLKPNDDGCFNSPDLKVGATQSHYT